MHGRHPQRPARARREVRTGGHPHAPIAVLVAALVAAGAVLVAGAVASSGSDEAATELAVIGDVAEAAVAPPPSVVAPPVDALPDVDLEGCTLEVVSVSLGDEGESVECVQKALMAAGYFDGPITGVFDEATDFATAALQHDRELYVDGIVGARTAESLGIWPGAESFIVRTSPPAPGATDLWGNSLSSVASAGDDAPPMPPDSGQGTGKRVVYDRAGQRVWAVDDEERVVRSYLVSGSQFRNEQPGVHRVYSRSEMSTAWNFEADLPLMIRYQQTERGHIGFHAIPIRKSDGTIYQTEDELGQKLSGGCQRQAPLDAQFLWAFATEGTRVIVT